jgi:Holliday junction resolvasome RuvABC ATP-dependent DNA helicase subunit
MLRSELLIRTPRGRRLTEKGFRHLGANPADYEEASLLPLM